ncbi:unnamed protein product [Mytilus coruscus]|uniref:Uncharacterized protein n=1 Tax=Mytilus coruscus TaxID=42192 RepID=A0A6J8EUS8_MYTCO|nr:unnamed protein product [Mytilus coruscus]
MNLPAPTNDVFGLRFYGDKLESYVRGLESLGQTPEMYGSLLVPVVLDKLPIEIRKSIAREHGRDNLILENLRKSITREIDILEAGCRRRSHRVRQITRHCIFLWVRNHNHTRTNQQTHGRRPINSNISQPSTSTVLVNVISYKNTGIDNKNGKYTSKLPLKQDQPDLPSNMSVAKSRTENISQRIVQSRPHVNPLDEKLQGRKSPPRAPVIAHLHLVESRSHIDTGQEQVTYKQDYRFVKMPCVPEETKR